MLSQFAALLSKHEDSVVWSVQAVFCCWVHGQQSAIGSSSARTSSEHGPVCLNIHLNSTEGYLFKCALTLNHVSLTFVAERSYGLEGFSAGEKQKKYHNGVISFFSTLSIFVAYPPFNLFRWVAFTLQSWIILLLSCDIVIIFNHDLTYLKSFPVSSTLSTWIVQMVRWLHPP